MINQSYLTYIPRLSCGDLVVGLDSCCSLCGIGHCRTDRKRKGRKNKSVQVVYACLLFFVLFRFFWLFLFCLVFCFLLLYYHIGGVGDGVSGDRGGVWLGVRVYGLVITDMTDDCISNLKVLAFLDLTNKRSFVWIFVICYDLPVAFFFFYLMANFTNISISTS